MDRSFLKYQKNEPNIKKGYLEPGEIYEIADEIAVQIEHEIKEDFRDVHLTYNLAATTHIERVNKSFIKVSVPAVRYNLSQFKRYGVISYTPEKGSYASTVSRTGGYSGYHKRYISNSIIHSCVNVAMGHGISEGAIHIKW